MRRAPPAEQQRGDRKDDVILRLVAVTAVVGASAFGLAFLLGNSAEEDSDPGGPGLPSAARQGERPAIARPPRPPAFPPLREPPSAPESPTVDSGAAPSGVQPTVSEPIVSDPTVSQPPVDPPPDPGTDEPLGVGPPE